MNGWKTIIGATIALVASVATTIGIDIGDQEGLVNGIIAIGGAVIAIYGRVVATKKIDGGELD
jgi:hypothetical protein